MGTTNPGHPLEPAESGQRSRIDESAPSNISETETIQKKLTLESCLCELVGRSPKFLRIVEELKVLAAADANVLISGETGTGKDMCARAIHYTGARADKPFVSINCGSIPEELWENQFFGHERGAYTDAREKATGILREADGGTLFLDDIETLAAKNQVKLLRVLQTGLYMPLGGVREARTNVRVIAATNEDLLGRMREHTFRGDLYFRLAVLLLHLSPLRERIEDIPVLASVFLKRFAVRYGRPVNRISGPALDALRRYSWPGNVRELENAIHRAVIHARGDEIDEIPIPGDEVTGPPPASSATALSSLKEMKHDLVASFEKQYLLSQLRNYGGNVSEAARQSGKNRRAFWELMRKYHITAGPAGDPQQHKL